MSNEEHFDMEYLLPYYTLQELAIKSGSTEDKLLRIAANGELFLSVLADGWKIESGAYYDGDGETEIVQYDDVIYGPLGVSANDIVKILKGGTAQIEYSVRTDDSFVRIVDVKEFPIISRSDLIVSPISFRFFLNQLRAKKAPAVNIPPVAKAGSLSNQAPNTVDGEASPWIIVDPKDPPPEWHWYTPARYFARQLVKKDTTLLTKKSILAEKTSLSLKNVGICKRGGKKPFATGTILKAFSNVTLG